MISATDFRSGMVIELDGDLMQIVESQHVKPGKGGAFVRAKFKNVLTGRVLEKTYRSGEKFEEARLEQQVWQYLYHDGDLYHFMHKESFEQMAVGDDIVGDKSKWIKENTDATLMFYKGVCISIEVPFFVELLITQCDPGFQGDRATGGSKPATLETGAVV
ncbi:MAG: elongation factor P, partial [Candidatus Hydrogenedentes bacterium]|nr:elongation factor P [Candidatus Hydrogenedentota bacterium]